MAVIVKVGAAVSGPMQMPDSGHVNIDTGAHEFVWQANERERECVEQFCSPKGRRECGTSIWFVNVVGQVATAGLTEFVSVAQPGVSISTS